MISRNEENLKELEQEAASTEYATTVLGNILSDVVVDEEKERNAQLEFVLKQKLEPNISEAETIKCFIKSCLSIEFNVLYADPQQQKMADLLTESLILNPFVKSEVLKYTSRVLQEKLNLKGKTKQ